MAWPLRKLFWMIVAIAAMVLLAPMAASAHEGHHPGVAVAGSALHGPAVERFHRVAAAETSTRVVALASRLEPSHSSAPCTEGCCAGMVCCAVAIVSALPAIVPPVWSLTQTSPRAPPFFAGLSPSSPLEPPNALT